MNNTFAQIDHLASAGDSPWHRSSALTKLLLVLTYVTLAVVTPSWGVLVALLVTLIAMCVSARAPLRLMFAAAATPFLFALIFAAAHVSTDWDEPLVLFARPMVASLAAVWLVITTPYPDLFAPIARVTPRLVGDGLFLTYRAFFLLVNRADRMWTALKLRGGLTGRGLPRDFRSAGEGLGQLVIHSYDRSQRLYAIMHIRGHSGRVCGCRHWAEFSAFDLVPVLFGLAALALRFWMEGR